MMKVSTYAQIAITGCCLAVITACNQKTEQENSPPTYTKVDSLTETYLEFQDSLLLVWNNMINDDNDKIKAMQNLLHELSITNQYNREEISNLEERIKQLARFRYDQKTMINEGLIEEYDFASNSLITELVGLAESHSAYSYNNVIQKLVGEIYQADQRVENYRAEYDALARRYNAFLDRNKSLMKEIDLTNALEKRPLFEMASDSQ